MRSLRGGRAGMRALRIAGGLAAAALHVAVGVALIGVGEPEVEDVAAGSFVVELAPDYTTAALPESELPVGALSSEAAESAPAATAKPVEAPQSEPVADAAPSEPELALPEPSPTPNTKPQEMPPNPTAETNQSAASTAAQAAAPPRIEAPESMTPTAPDVGLSPQRQRARATWHKSIAMHLERFKRYPEAARAKGATGMVVVKFRVNRAGHVTEQSVDRSAGSEALDTAAIDLLRRAGALPAPPPELPGEGFTLSVPVLFQLPRARTTAEHGVAAGRARH